MTHGRAFVRFKRPEERDAALTFQARGCTLGVVGGARGEPARGAWFSCQVGWPHIASFTAESRALLLLHKTLCPVGASGSSEINASRHIAPPCLPACSPGRPPACFPAFLPACSLTRSPAHLTALLQEHGERFVYAGCQLSVDRPRGEYSLHENSSFGVIAGHAAAMAAPAAAGGAAGAAMPQQQEAGSTPAAGPAKLQQQEQRERPSEAPVATFPLAVVNIGASMKPGELLQYFRWVWRRAACVGCGAGWHAGKVVPWQAPGGRKVPAVQHVVLSPCT